MGERGFTIKHFLDFIFAWVISGLAIKTDHSLIFKEFILIKFLRILFLTKFIDYLRNTHSILFLKVYFEMRHPDKLHVFLLIYVCSKIEGKILWILKDRYLRNSTPVCICLFGRIWVCFIRNIRILILQFISFNIILSTKVQGNLRDLQFSLNLLTFSVFLKNFLSRITKKLFTGYNIVDSNTESFYHYTWII